MFGGIPFIEVSNATGTNVSEAVNMLLVETILNRG